jgi:hypothetical protein
MRILLFSILILKSIILSAQFDSLKLTPNAKTKIVVNTPFISTDKLYNNTLNWVKKNAFMSVLKTDENNIWIKGQAYDVWNPKRGGILVNYGLAYNLQIYFINGSYILYYNFGNFIKNGQKINATPKDLFFKFNGKVKKVHTKLVAGTNNRLQNINSRLYKYILLNSDSTFLASKK